MMNRGWKSAKSQSLRVMSRWLAWKLKPRVAVILHLERLLLSSSNHLLSPRWQFLIDLASKPTTPSLLRFRQAPLKTLYSPTINFQRIHLSYGQSPHPASQFHHLSSHICPRLEDTFQKHAHSMHQRIQQPWELALTSLSRNPYLCLISHPCLLQELRKFLSKLSPAQWKLVNRP